MSTVQVEKKDHLQETSAVQTIYFKNQLELIEQRRQRREQKVAQLIQEIDEFMGELKINNINKN
ncbi:hypothetical protein ABER75_11860 [Niallia taxi]|uniref:hypothetical protein n=1 Tax=Niallia taxi TaxID=2499688 RepID=UPI0020421211|nr:hypothetical protein [Niallia taxi]MCM3216783.1 hypothetical protein [Niallia taxi]